MVRFVLMVPVKLVCLPILLLLKLLIWLGSDMHSAETNVTDAWRAESPTGIRVYISKLCDHSSRYKDYSLLWLLSDSTALIIALLLGFWLSHSSQKFLVALIG